jgi:hypothetical protein
VLLEVFGAFTAIFTVSSVTQSRHAISVLRGWGKQNSRGNWYDMGMGEIARKDAITGADRTKGIVERRGGYKSVELLVDPPWAFQGIEPSPCGNISMSHARVQL